MPYDDGKLWGYMDLDKWNNFEDRIIVIPAKYEQADDFHDDLARVKENGKFGYIDKSGNYVLLPYLSEATDFENGVAFVRVGTRSFIINTQGKELEPPATQEPTIIIPSVKYVNNIEDREHNPTAIPEGLSILRLRLNW